MATESSRTPLGIGLVSVGWMGRVHSTSLARITYHFPELQLEPRFIIAADTLPERAQFAVSQLGYQESSADWHDVIAHPAVQAVSITAPNYLHREVALAASAAGKHFWIEKPVGRNVQETSDIVQAAQRAGVRTAVGFNYRHVPAVAYARELVATGAIGQPTHVRGIFFTDYAADPRAALSWRFQRALAGAGALDDLLSHVVDLLHYVVGPIREVAGLTNVFTSHRPLSPPDATHFTIVENGELAPVENDDYAAALLRFEGGAVGTCEASRVSVGPSCQVGFDIYGSDGAVSWNFERMNELRVCGGRQTPNYGFTTVNMGPTHGEFARFQPGPAIAMGYDDLKVIEAARFLTSIASDTEVGSTVADALAAARVLDAVAKAAESGQWVTVDAQVATVQ